MTSFRLSKLVFLVAFLCHSQLVASFSLTPSDRTFSKMSLSFSFSSHAADEMPEGDHPNRRSEFNDLVPMVESSTRKARMKEERRIQRQFVKHGDRLWMLREVMYRLTESLLKAMKSGIREEEDDIREQLRGVAEQDPELVYKLELQNLRKAKDEGRFLEAEGHSRKAMDARSCLPQYNLDGLWVGKYGNHGYEMINVTYQGDLMIAYKVTGDNNVPRGEITFQADLHPLPPNAIGGGTPDPAPLKPISLTDKAAKKWGTMRLPRYKGMGQVAEAEFSNNQWMDGQLIVIGEEYFSFAWVPIESQIFFGRPSPEVALKMLRESSVASAVGAKIWQTPPSINADVNVLKEYVASCLEKTNDTIEEGLEGDSCIWHGMDTEECCFQ